MSCKLLLTGLLVVVTVVFCAGRSVAQQGDKPASELEAISKQLNELNKSVEELKGKAIATNEKLNHIRKTIAVLKLDIDDVQKELATVNKTGVVNTTSAKIPVGKEPAGPEANSAAMSNEEMKRRIEKLEQEIARTRVSSRIANYPAETSRILLINDFPYEATVIVNGRSYHIPGRDSLLLDNQPSGPFTYQVLGVQPDLMTRFVQPNKEYKIRVY